MSFCALRESRDISRRVESEHESMRERKDVEHIEENFHWLEFLIMLKLNRKKVVQTCVREGERLVLPNERAERMKTEKILWKFQAQQAKIFFLHGDAQSYLNQNSISFSRQTFFLIRCYEKLKILIDSRNDKTRWMEFFSLEQLKLKNLECSLSSLLIRVEE